MQAQISFTPGMSNMQGVMDRYIMQEVCFVESAHLFAVKRDLKGIVGFGLGFLYEMGKS